MEIKYDQKKKKSQREDDAVRKGKGGGMLKGRNVGAKKESNKSWVLCECMWKREKDKRRESFHDLSISDHKFWETDQSQSSASYMTLYKFSNK